MRSVIVLTSLLLSLYGGSIRFTTPMLFALAFLPMFGIGGLPEPDLHADVHPGLAGVHRRLWTARSRSSSS
jgi:hypothetical protein